MKTIKPQKLGLLTRCFEYEHRFYFGISVLMFVPLCGEPDLLSEVSMWELVAAELGKDGILEASIPKARAEFLVTGFAYPAGGQPSPGCMVKVALGNREKALHVFGDRAWRHGRVTEPEPFTQMALSWQQAYGGPGFAENPLGKGVKPGAGEQGKAHMLPNLQYPQETAHLPNVRMTPAGFSPLDISWPQRISKSGTYDSAWLQEDFPAFARDIDWAIFNIAPQDQWFSGHLQGNEPYLLENLHPQKPRIEGALPDFKARCFITRQTQAGSAFEEVSTRLSTVWFFPHRERAVLIHQGLCEVIDEDGSDIVHLVIGAERLTEPRSEPHYKDVLEKRLDKEKGMLFALKDSLLVPAGLPDSSVVMPPDEDLIRQKMRKRAEREIARARSVVESHGLDPDVHAPKPLPPEEPLPDLEHLPEFMKKLEEKAEEEKKKARAGMAQSERRVEALFASLNMDYEQIRKEYTRKPSGPPDFSAQEKIDHLRGLADQQRQEGQDPAEIEGYLNDQAFIQRFYDGEQKLKALYRIAAHHQDPASPKRDEPGRILRQMVMSAYANGQSLAGKDLTGVDLSGLDLRNADFENALMESANLESADLSGARLGNAVLAHANLKMTRMTGADLRNANLGKAICIECNAADTDCRDAILAGADLTGACFKDARMDGCNCSGAVFSNTDFSGIQAAQLSFLESDLRGLKFSGARLQKCIFLKVDLSGVDFSGAFLHGTVFLEVIGKHCCFTAADMTNTRFVGDSVFDASTFVGSRLIDANLRGVSLRDCNFSEALIDRADFSGCDLRNATFYRAVGREVSFVKAKLNDAKMISLNAMHGSLQRADLRGADLRGANLYQVDMARVYADQRTQLGDTFTRKVRIYPKRVRPHES
jgi:uncharacterized protein YjbI with pentapeptide repeats